MYRYFEIIIIFSGAFCTCEQIHVLEHSYGCFNESGDTLLAMTLDDDEIYHVDFKSGAVVEWESRVPSTLQSESAKFYARYYQEGCLGTMQENFLDTTYDIVKEDKEAPETVIYPKDDGIIGEENTLICFVKDFFPPSIKVKWTKNDVEVTLEDRVLSYLPNPDGTFRHISTLTFTPQEGDVYACTVEHEALQEPQTRFWDPDITESSSAPAVFCGVGLTLGLLGITTGTFLFVKAKHFRLK